MEKYWRNVKEILEKNRVMEKLKIFFLLIIINFFYFINTKIPIIKNTLKKVIKL